MPVWFSVRTDVVVPFEQTREPYGDWLRARVFNEMHARLAEDDWWLILDADEFLTDDPRAAIDLAVRQRADIINTRRSYVGVMAKAGAVTRYRTPLRAALRDGFTDKEGFVNGIYAQPRVFLYNTNMIPRDKAPQAFEDLLDRRWKEKLGMDTTDYDWLAALIDYYGRGKALEFAAKLSKQQLNLRRGPTLLAQLAVAGEFPVVIDAFPEEIMQMKNAKAPADFIFSEPFVAVKTPTTISIAAGAPHPHAAALFVDFLLSKAGQDLMAGQGRWVSRKDGNYFADLKGKKMQIPSVEWDEKQVELIKLYNGIFGLN